MHALQKPFGNSFEKGFDKQGLVRQTLPVMFCCHLHVQKAQQSRGGESAIGEDEVSNSEEWKADAGEICKSPVEILKDRLIANNKELLLESLTQIRLISTTIQQGRQRLHRYC
jgi:hypothetical protein